MTSLPALVFSRFPIGTREIPAKYIYWPVFALPSCVVFRLCTRHFTAKPHSFDPFDILEMKLTSCVAAGALATVVLAKEAPPASTETVYFYGSTDTHVYGRFDKTEAESSESETGTHRYGRFDKTEAESSPSETGTHVYGRFDKTQAESSESETGTHRYGRFDKTEAESSPSETGTHRYGRFDKTEAESSPSETGTHVYGRFDKTREPVTTTIFITDALESVAAAAAANGTNGSSSSSSKAGAARISGITYGAAGALAVGLFLL